MKHFAPNFEGVKNCEIWPQFSIPVNFKALWFRNGVTCRKSKISTWSPVFVSTQTLCLSLP